MIYLMNSAVMPAGNYGLFRYSPATVKDLRKVVQGDLGPWSSTIGYPQNADLIKKWTGVRVEISRAETRFEKGDRALVMRLIRRVANPSSKGAPVSEDPCDWEFAWVSFEGGED